MNATPRTPHGGDAIATPTLRPASPLFSTGPTRKRPGWTPQALPVAALGRSHRAPHPKSRLQDCIARIHRVLALPDDYIVGIVPASDTGAVEMAMWSLLGLKPGYQLDRIQGRYFALEDERSKERTLYSLSRDAVLATTKSPIADCWQDTCCSVCAVCGPCSTSYRLRAARSL